MIQHLQTMHRYFLRMFRCTARVLTDTRKKEMTMSKTRKTLHVKARKNSAGGKFQAEIETVGVLGIADIAERWTEGMALKPGMAKALIGSLEDCILDALSDGYQLNFGLVSFYPRLSSALPSRDSDPESEDLFVRGAVKARKPLVNGLKGRLDAVNSLSSSRPRIFSVFDRDTERFDVIAAGHTLTVSGRDIQIDVSDPEEGVWIEKRTKHGYERVSKARLLRSDCGMAEFILDDELPPRKYLVAIATRSGKGKNYKVVTCRHEVVIQCQQAVARLMTEVEKGENSIADSGWINEGDVLAEFS